MWVRSIKGTDISRVYLKQYVEGFRGMHAVKDIYSGNNVLFMPLSTIIMSDIMYNTQIGRKMLAKEHVKKAEKVFLYYYIM